MNNNVTKPMNNAKNPNNANNSNSNTCPISLNSRREMLDKNIKVFEICYKGMGKTVYNAEALARWLKKHNTYPHNRQLPTEEELLRLSNLVPSFRAVPTQVGKYIVAPPDGEYEYTERYDEDWGSDDEGDPDSNIRPYCLDRMNITQYARRPVATITNLRDRQEWDLENENRLLINYAMKHLFEDVDAFKGELYSAYYNDNVTTKNITNEVFNQLDNIKITRVLYIVDSREFPANRTTGTHNIAFVFKVRKTSGSVCTMMFVTELFTSDYDCLYWSDQSLAINEQELVSKYKNIVRPRVPRVSRRAQSNTQSSYSCEVLYKNDEGEVVFPWPAATAGGRKSIKQNKTMYKGKQYSVKTGKRGGKYILVQGKKVYT